MQNLYVWFLMGHSEGVSKSEAKESICAPSLLLTNQNSSRFVYFYSSRKLSSLWTRVLTLRDKSWIAIMQAVRCDTPVNRRQQWNIYRWLQFDICCISICTHLCFILNSNNVFGKTSRKYLLCYFSTQYCRNTLRCVPFGDLSLEFLSTVGHCSLTQPR